METLREAGWLGWTQLGLAGAGGLWALVAAVLLAMRWKVPPVVAVAPLLAHASVLILAGVLGTNGLDVPAASSEKATLAAAAIAQVIANRVLCLAALPSALILLLGGAAAGVRGRRAWGAPAFVALTAMAVAVVPLVGIASGVPIPLAALRFVLYGIAGLPLVAALAGAHPQDNSREGSLVAAAAFATVVAAGEALTVGHLWANGFSAMAAVAGESKGELIAALIAEQREFGTLAGVALALASLPAVVALLRPPAELTEEEILSGTTSPSMGRWLAGAFALLVPLFWGGAFVASDAASLLSQLAARFP